MATSPTSLDDATQTRETFPAASGAGASTDGVPHFPQFHAQGKDRNNFTLRGLLAGLLIGVLICFCNTYFGLQTGWGSGMSLPSSLIGFALFKSISKYLKTPFQPVENVLVQTVAGAVGTMSLGCGFVGFIPAIEFLLKPAEGAPIELGIGRLIVWSLGVCFFGSVFAVILRKQVIIREKLRFPSGTATALLIEVLHGQVIEPKGHTHSVVPDEDEAHGLLRDDEHGRLATHELSDAHENVDHFTAQEPATPRNGFNDHVGDRYVQLLIQAFNLSAVYTVFSYFVPQIRDIPIFGTFLAKDWLWTLNPSPAYLGQGAIMGVGTSIHLLLGAIIGWGILSPLARNKGWAPGSIDDLETGSKGWIMWISLAMMLADSMTNLGWLALRPLMRHGPEWLRSYKTHLRRGGSWHDLVPLRKMYQRYTSLAQPELNSPTSYLETEALPQELVSNTTISILLPLSLAFCVLCTQLSFGSYIPPALSTLATLLSLIATLMGVRALGETDLNPASGIAKLVQLAFALVTHKDDPNAIIISSIAGTIAESGAGQGGDMMQDLKTGHLLNASPKVQFYSQVIGSIFGVVVSSIVYRLYVAVYELPSQQFQMPSAYLWIFTARLVTGKGLPPMVLQFGSWAGLIFIITTVLRIYLGSHSSAKVRKLQRFVPGGIAVAVGMYTTPSFSIPRAIGGVLSWWYMRRYKTGETIVTVISSGLILGEGIVSMVNLGLAGVGVPHL